VHTEAHYNLVFHAIAWESKKEIWDKIQDGFTAIQQKLIKDGNTDDSTRFSNEPDSKLNNASSLIYPNQFLLTGLSGTGKSTATLAMALEILKSVGKLTTNIALVHKTLE
jgi:DNA replication protein DnaC